MDDFSPHRDAAGANFDRFGVSHAGLGVWDTTSDVKFSIELLSQDYVGALLPQLNSADGSITWNNAGNIVVTNPLVESSWLNSRLVTTTSGNSWNQLLTFLQSNQKLFEVVQPVAGLYLNASLVNASVIYSTDDINSIGELVIEPSNSFVFVDTLVTQLGSYGCDLGAFLQIYATSFDYIAASKATPSIVSLENANANAAVYAWYVSISHTLPLCFTSH
jgi:hypothetical protein